MIFFCILLVSHKESLSWLLLPFLFQNYVKVVETYKWFFHSVCAFWVVNIPKGGGDTWTLTAITELIWNFCTQRQFRSWNIALMLLTPTSPKAFRRSFWYVLVFTFKSDLHVNIHLLLSVIRNWHRKDCTRNLWLTLRSTLNFTHFKLHFKFFCQGHNSSSRPGKWISCKIALQFIKKWFFCFYVCKTEPVCSSPVNAEPLGSSMWTVWMNWSPLICCSIYLNTCWFPEITLANWKWRS